MQFVLGPDNYSRKEIIDFLKRQFPQDGFIAKIKDIEQNKEKNETLMSENGKTQDLKGSYGVQVKPILNKVARGTADVAVAGVEATAELVVAAADYAGKNAPIAADSAAQSGETAAEFVASAAQSGAEFVGHTGENMATALAGSGAAAATALAESGAAAATALAGSGAAAAAALAARGGQTVRTTRDYSIMRDVSNFKESSLVSEHRVHIDETGVYESLNKQYVISKGSQPQKKNEGRIPNTPVKVSGRDGKDFNYRLKELYTKFNELKIAGALKNYANSMDGGESHIVETIAARSSEIESTAFLSIDMVIENHLAVLEIYGQLANLIPVEAVFGDDGDTWKDQEAAGGWEVPTKEILTFLVHAHDVLKLGSAIYESGEISPKSKDYLKIVLPKLKTVIIGMQGLCDKLQPFHPKIVVDGGFYPNPMAEDDEDDEDDAGRSRSRKLGKKSPFSLLTMNPVHSASARNHAATHRRRSGGAPPARPQPQPSGTFEQEGGGSKGGGSKRIIIKTKSKRKKTKRKKTKRKKTNRKRTQTKRRN